MSTRLKALTDRLRGKPESGVRPDGTAYATPVLPAGVADVAEPDRLIDILGFEDVGSFVDFYRAAPHILSIENAHAAARQAGKIGIHCPVFGEHVAPDRLRIDGDNYRETLVHRGLNSRLRAVQYVLQNETAHIPAESLRLYAPEAVTAYAGLLKARHKHFIGSEYGVDPEILARIGPIRIEDLHELTFEDASFDAAVANEVFEHIPFLDKALSELARILVPGGKLVSTFPFLAMQQDSIVRAKLENGEIVHLTEPEYHGNPVDAQGSLVFELPGWNIIERTRAAGFSSAVMKWVYSPAYGMIAPGTAGILVLVATK